MLKEICNRELVTVEPDTRVSECAKVMAERHVGTVLVLSNGRPRGIITDRDIVVRCVASHTDVDDTTVENIMSESLEVASITDGIFDCIRRMHRAQVRRIPVVDENGKAVGIISFDDMLSVLSKEFAELTAAIEGDRTLEHGDELAA